MPSLASTSARFAPAAFLLFLSACATSDDADSRPAVESPPVAYLDRTAEQWIADFRASEQERREDAVDALEALGPDMIPKLLPELSDGEGAVRYSALAALSRYGADAAPAAREIAICVRDPEARIRAEAAYALMRIGPAAAAAGTSPLAEALTDPEWYVRYRAAGALESFGARAYPEGYEGLRRIERKDENVRVRTAAKQAADEVWHAHWLARKPRADR